MLFHATGPGNDTTSRRSAALPATDRKSTRLNSSHSQMSSAVFCLKKKGDVAAVVLRAERRPDPLGDVPAERAELRHVAGGLRVRERIVVADHDVVLPAALVLR